MPGTLTGVPHWGHWVRAPTLLSGALRVVRHVGHGNAIMGLTPGSHASSRQSRFMRTWLDCQRVGSGPLGALVVVSVYEGTVSARCRRSSLTMLHDGRACVQQKGGRWLGQAGLGNRCRSGGRIATLPNRLRQFDSRCRGESSQAAGGTTPKRLARKKGSTLNRKREKTMSAEWTVLPSPAAVAF